MGWEQEYCVDDGAGLWSWSMEWEQECCVDEGGGLWNGNRSVVWMMELVYAMGTGVLRIAL